METFDDLLHSRPQIGRFRSGLRARSKPKRGDLDLSLEASDRELAKLAGSSPQATPRASRDALELLVFGGRPIRIDINS